MKNKLITIILIIGAILFAGMPALANDEPIDPELSIPGTVEGTGNSFQITDSEYINVSLESTEEITILLESIPKTISLNLEASSIAGTTQLTLGGLEENTIYYKFEDSYKNKVEFTTNENQNYTWTQDLTSDHHIWFQLGTAVEAGIQTMGIQTQSESDGTIFLPDDCVYPYGDWDEDTSTCTLTQDLFESVEIAGNDFILDCGGHVITGDNAGYGIYAYAKSGIVIKNCTMSNFSYGIYLLFSSNNIVSDNNISQNYAGILTVETSDNDIIHNTILNNQLGVCVSHSSDNHIINNIIKENTNIGIALSRSSLNEVKDNQILNNSRGLYLWAAKNVLVDNNNIENNITGIDIEAETTNSAITNNTFVNGGILVGCFVNYQTYNNVIENNTVNNKPIVYLENKSNQTIDNAGQVILIDCDNITVRDVDLSNSSYGIQLIGTNNSTFDKVIVNSNIMGISLSISSNNTISNSDISNSQIGIIAYDLYGNTIINNNIDSNRDGIRAYYFHDNILKNNTFSNSFVRALSLSYSSDNNLIYHNNFIDNNRQVDIFQSESLFDNGYPDDFDLSTHGGNYWDSYLGIDEKSGPNQDQSGSDGIGDTSYIIYGGHAVDEDRYVFMEQDGWGTVVCGNGVCEKDETFESCYQDCSAQGIEKYFPYWKFSRGERYHPTSFYFDNDADVKNNKENYEAGQGYWMNPYVYVHTVEDENYFAIQYWKYEAYNEHWFWGNHDHDWDATIFLVFDKNNLDEPMEVRFARHYFVGAYPWSMVEKKDITHPVTYVAEGGHGGYHSENMGYFDIFNSGGLIYTPEFFNYYKVGNCIEETLKEINGEQREFCLLENKLLKGEAQNEPVDGYWPNEFDDVAPWKSGSEDAPFWRKDRWNETRPIGAERVLKFKIACPVDLHVYDPQDRHVGINYETNEPEIEIPDAIFRQQDEKQYIMIPNPPKGDYRVEIVGTDDGEYDFTMIASEDMKLIEMQEKGNIPIAKDEVQIFTALGLWETPREMKEKTIDDLNSIENNGIIIQGNIQKVISSINKSLNQKYWIDDAHLDSKQGGKVFNYELGAILHLKLLEKLIGGVQSSNIVKNITKKLIKADYLLAKTILDETKEIDIENHCFKKRIEEFIIKAEKELIKAKDDLENGEPIKSIIHSKKSWNYSQMAIKFINK